MINLKTLEQTISSWPEVSVHPHRFGGREFRFRAAEIGHIHTGGIVDIPFPRPIHDALLDEGLAEQHRWVPDSGWITFRVQNDRGFDHALWLMRLSYLRYALKAIADPVRELEQESEQLSFSPRFRSLMEPFLPKSARQVARQPVPA